MYSLTPLCFLWTVPLIYLIFSIERCHIKNLEIQYQYVRVYLNKISHTYITLVHCISCLPLYPVRLCVLSTCVSCLPVYPDCMFVLSTCVSSLPFFLPVWVSCLPVSLVCLFIWPICVSCLPVSPACLLSCLYRCSVYLCLLLECLPYLLVSSCISYLPV